VLHYWKGHLNSANMTAWADNVGSINFTSVGDPITKTIKYFNIDSSKNMLKIQNGVDNKLILTG